MTSQIWNAAQHAHIDTSRLYTQQDPHITIHQDKIPMPYRLYVLNGQNSIADPIELHIAKNAASRLLRARYQQIRRVIGPPKAYRWVLW